MMYGEVVSSAEKMHARLKGRSPRSREVIEEAQSATTKFDSISDEGMRLVLSLGELAIPASLRIPRAEFGALFAEWVNLSPEQITSIISISKNQRIIDFTEQVQGEGKKRRREYYFDRNRAEAMLALCFTYRKTKGNIAPANLPNPDEVVNAVRATQGALGEHPLKRYFSMDYVNANGGVPIKGIGSLPRRRKR